MAEELKAGPMNVKKQTVLEIRSRGAPTRGAGGLINRSLLDVVSGLWPLVEGSGRMPGLGPGAP